MPDHNLLTNHSSNILQTNHKSVDMSLGKGRLDRLKKRTSKLGEPDLFSLVKVETVNSFLSHKKNIDVNEYFVVGLDISTTAHISYYVNQKIKESWMNQKDVIYRATLCIYNAYKELDLHVEINVPGSLEVRGYNLNGLAVRVDDEDYSSAYYCSILRSLYPSNYHPQTQRFMQVQKYAVLQNFIKEFVPFSIDNVISSDQQDTMTIIDEPLNLGLEALIYYILRNQFWDLADILLDQLRVVNMGKYRSLSLEIKYRQRKYEEVVISTAQQLLDEKSPKNVEKKLKILQIKSLVKLKKVKQVKILREILIREGLQDIDTWKQILELSLYANENQSFIKLLNTCLTFVGEETSYYSELEKALYPLPCKEVNNSRINKSQCISKLPHFCFNFDQQHLDNYSQLQAFRDTLRRTKKQQSTLQILQRLQYCFTKTNTFQSYLHRYQKTHGWNSLLELRSKCFWLQCDFILNDDHIQKRSDVERSYRFKNQSFIDSESQLPDQHRNNPNQAKRSIKQRKQQGQSTYQVYQLDEQISDTQSQTGKQPLEKLPPCSKRTNTKRINIEMKTINTQLTKILCHYSLQKVFINCYNFLKLQNDTEKWASHLQIEKVQQISKQKQQLLSIIFLKKAFLHQKLQRYRKAEQSLKIAYKCSTTITTSLVACHMLIDLYLKHKSLKGMQYYVIEIVRILWQFGVEKYDILPQWSRKVIPSIIRAHGIDIVNTMKGPFKQLIQKWLQIGTDLSKHRKNKETDKQ